MTRRRRLLPGACLLAVFATPACLSRPVENPNIIVASMTSGPNNLDPRLGTDDSSARIHQLIFNALVELDDDLRVSPALAERLENPEPHIYVARLRQGVRFHDGRLLTADDVVYTFRSLLEPGFVSPLTGAFRLLQAVDAVDDHTVRFTLAEPFPSFPFNLVPVGIVPAGAGASVQRHPIGTGPYRFVRHAVDDRIELAAFVEYHGGPPRNEGIVIKIVPDDVMRGLELKKGTMDLVVNDLGPDIVHQLKQDGGLRTVEAPGVDYQYVGLNLRDPVLSNVLVRRALAHAIDREAIVEHLRRGLAEPAAGLVPPLSWAHATDVPIYEYDPARARALLDEAGYPDPDGAGGRPRFRLTLKVSNVEFNRLQSAVIQSDLRAVGIELDIRTYEFATLYADVIAGNFQMYTLQWAGGALADPDILRRVFHSRQRPPSGFNRGAYSNPEVDELLDAATVTVDEGRRRELYLQVQRAIAADLPYISLWYKTNFVVAQRTLQGIRLSPVADFFFLKDVVRLPPTAAN